MAAPLGEIDAPRVDLVRDAQPFDSAGVAGGVESPT